MAHSASPGHDDMPALWRVGMARMNPPSVNEVLEHYAIRSAVWGWQRQAMPLGSMVSFILQSKPCTCHAHCWCDGGPPVAEPVEGVS